MHAEQTRAHFQVNRLVENSLVVSAVIGGLSWSKMGTRFSKAANRREQGKELGDSQRSLRKISKKQKENPAKGAHGSNVPDKKGEKRTRKRLTLQELHNNPPLGFRKFESEMDWQNMDEEIALQMWEDVYKPTYTFYRCTRIAK